MRVLVSLLLLAAGALAGCGDDDEQPAASGRGTELVVEVRPEGDDGPVRRRTVTDVPPTINADAFAPTPDDVACTEIYGGPATAHVSGTLDGEPVDATFSRENGCEIARWDRLERLLGQVPGAVGP